MSGSQCEAPPKLNGVVRPLTPPRRVIMSTPNLGTIQQEIDAVEQDEWAL